MIKLPDTVEQKAAKEKPISEMQYESSLDWRYMKKLRSETQVRHWHIKVHCGKFDNKNQPIFEDFNILQTWVPRGGEKLMAYPATRSGRPVDLASKNKIFEKIGTNHLHGIEYLLRTLEGQDISKLRLDKDQPY